MTPQAEEALFEFAVVVVGEVAEEAADHLALLVGEVGYIVELVDVAQVGEDLVGRAHVLVEIVEVGEQQLAPAVEVVEGLVDARAGGEGLVELTDEQDGVGNLQLRVAAEEVADGDVGGAPEGLTSEAGEVLVEEERGTLVGEDDGHAGEVGAISGEQVGCYVFEE